MCRKPPIFSSFRAPPLFRKILQRGSQLCALFLSSRIHFLSFHVCLKSMPALPEFYPFTCSFVFPFKLLVRSFSFKAALLHFLSFLPSSFKRQHTHHWLQSCFSIHRASGLITGDIAQPQLHKWAPTLGGSCWPCIFKNSACWGHRDHPRLVSAVLGLRSILHVCGTEVPKEIPFHLLVLCLLFN